MSIYDYQLFLNLTVAPHAGAWIEINVSLSGDKGISVAPHAGAWIEMMDTMRIKLVKRSHLTQVCGLKFLRNLILLN